MSKILVDKEILEQALEAWDGGDIEWFKRAYTVMENLRAALAQQAEPVAQYSDIVSDGGMEPRNKFDTLPAAQQVEGEPS